MALIATMLACDAAGGVRRGRFGYAGIATWTMTVIGSSCRMKLVNRLKPGKRIYGFNCNSGAVSDCSGSQITHTQCSAF